MKALLIKFIIINIGSIIGDILFSGDNVTQIVAALISLFGVIVALKVKSRVEKVDIKVDAYHKEVDGMKGELVAAVKGKGEAEGNLQGRIEQTEEKKVEAEATK